MNSPTPLPYAQATREKSGDIGLALHFHHRFYLRWTIVHFLPKRNVTAHHHHHPPPIVIWIKAKLVYFTALDGQVLRKWPLSDIFSTQVMHKCVLLIEGSNNAGIFRGNHRSLLGLSPHHSCLLPHVAGTVNAALHLFNLYTWKHITGTYYDF